MLDGDLLYARTLMSSTFMRRNTSPPLRRGKADVKSLLDSLDAYLIHNASVTAAAATLHCHPNTLRYRLSRFEELTSCSIEHTETRIELAWLLESMKAKDQPIN